LYRCRVMLSFIYIFFVAVFIFVILNAAYHFSCLFRGNWLLPRTIFRGEFIWRPSFRVNGSIISVPLSYRIDFNFSA
jgi:hypothetical protein